MSPLLDAILTADSEGYLKPSHVQTPQAKELVDRGLAAICPTTSDPLNGCAWERLTPAGMLAARLCRETTAALESRLAATWPKGDEG